MIKLLSPLRKVEFTIFNACPPQPPTRLREASAEQGRGRAYKSATCKTSPLGDLGGNDFSEWTQLLYYFKQISE